ncbi:MAG TPA: ATP-binding protein, partial [Roseiflexaceae bacterium]|nr:ATP-binding protein [Roseiflexaceae bacterium]
MAFSPDSFLDAGPDPLDTALAGARQGGVVVSAELRVRYGDGMPLQSATTSEIDMLAPLAAQLRPAGGAVRYAELCVVPQAASSQHPTVAWWRMAAVRRLGRERGAISARGADRLEHKLSGVVFHATVRVVLVADNAAAGRAALRAIASSLGQYGAEYGGQAQAIFVGAARFHRIERGHMLARHLRHGRAAPPLPPLILPCAAWRPPALLGAQELAGLWHLPTPSLAGLVAWLPNRHLPAPTHAFVAQAGQPVASPQLTFGHAVRADGTQAAVGPTLRDLRQILHITAGMGGGKSRLLANLAQQLFASGFFLIDGKGDDAGNLARTVAHLVPLADERRLAWLDIADYEWPIGLNPMAAFDASQPGALDQLVATLEATFARLDPETWRQAPGMQQFLGHAARLARLAEPRPTLTHVQRVLLNDAYRETLLERMPVNETAQFWRDVFPRMPDSQRSSMLALLRRFEKLIGSDLLRGVFAQPHSTVDLSRMFDER